MVAAGRRISGPGRRERSGDGSGPTPRRELGGPVPPAREAHGAGPSGLPGLGSSQRARSGAAAEEPRPPSGGRARAEARFLARPWVARGRRGPPRGGTTPGSLSAARAPSFPANRRRSPRKGPLPDRPAAEGWLLGRERGVGQRLRDAGRRGVGSGLFPWSRPRKGMTAARGRGRRSARGPFPTPQRRDRSPSHRMGRGDDGPVCPGARGAASPPLSREPRFDG